MENNFYVDVYGGRPVSGRVATYNEYVAACEEFPNFCGSWEVFSSEDEAWRFIDSMR